MIVFDLDHTLFRVNSSVYFGIFLYKKGVIKTLPFLFTLVDYLRHKYFNFSIQSLYNHAFERFFKDHRLEYIEGLVDEFVSKNLSKLLNQPIFKKLEDARSNNQKIILLSSSPHFLVESISRYLKIDGQGSPFQCNIYGILTHSDRVLDGNEKADYVKKLASQMNVLLSDITSYSDSHLDLPLLEIVGNPIGVSPDPKLKQICLQNNWKII